MKNSLLLTLSTLTVATLLTACGQAVPYVNTDNSDECATVNKKLIKVNNFTQAVTETRAFHLEESAAAIVTPGITVSNNKRQMLRDAAKRKRELEAEHKALGCETVAD
jgi:UDP-N-acetylmuramoylalanine-D-glutamate ligase